MVKRNAARVKRVEQLDIKSLLVQYANEFDVQQFVKIEERQSPTLVPTQDRKSLIINYSLVTIHR